MATFSYGYTLGFPGAGSPGRAVWHMRVDPGLGTTVQEAVDVIDQFYTTLMGLSLFAPPYTVLGDEVAINVVDQQTTPIVPVSLAIAGPAVEFNPTGQIVCTLRTSSATRSGRGRKFLGPVRGSVTDVDGTPDTAVLTSIQTACNTLVSTSEGLTEAAIGVYSRTQGLFRDVIAMQARNYMAVLRSRRD